MTDSKSKTISLALYRFMCQNIVGSETHVNSMRLMNTAKDNVSSHTNVTVITSGSFGEGLELRGSDLDVMYVTKSIEVFEDFKTANTTVYLCLEMETDDVKPGFTQLLIEQIHTQFPCKHCEEHNGKHYFSGTSFKQEIMWNTDTVVHGPCVSDKEGKWDQAMCLHCRTWISQASHWITRSNNSWPSYSVKQSIIKHGVLFVSIGVKGSPKEDIEWRISFSVGEKFLINTFTHTQLICYALLKILLKDVIATYAECENLLCSYFLKTIIFWVSEELPQSIWKPENLIHCFMRCFSRLIYSVDYSICLHYFIPENNMFEDKIQGHAREILLEKLYTLHSYGWRCILFSNQISNFLVSKWNADNEPHTLNIIELSKTLNSKCLYLGNSMNSFSFQDTNTYKRGIYQIVSIFRPFLKYLCTYFMSWRCKTYVQSVLLHSTRRSNKHQYKQYKSFLCTLLQTVYHDAVSGWLMVASFFYKAKQYNEALHIIMYTLSKCTPEKLYSFINVSDMHYQLVKQYLFQNRSFVKLWKIMLIDVITFVPDSWLIPNELQMEVENESYSTSSIVYAYFLKLLCHYHLNSVRQCTDCLYTLQLVIAESYLIEKSRIFHSRAYNILGIAFQLLGENKSAQQAFIMSANLISGSNIIFSKENVNNELVQYSVFS